MTVLLLDVRFFTATKDAHGASDSFSGEEKSQINDYAALMQKGAKKTGAPGDLVEQMLFNDKPQSGGCAIC